MGVGVAVASVAMGASVIEKHFTLARSDGGVDSAFSLEPHELQVLMDESERAWQSLGSVTYGPTDGEKKSFVFRRSIYAKANISRGEIFTQDNICIVRPGDGLPPVFFNDLLGRPSRRSFSKGEQLGLANLL